MDTAKENAKEIPAATNRRFAGLSRLCKGRLRDSGKGIRTIHNIREGDFNLHDGFFSSLKNVNPVIRRYAKVADIAAFQVRILRARAADDAGRAGRKRLYDRLNWITVKGCLITC
jgi:hypothetical protein